MILWENSMNELDYIYGVICIIRLFLLPFFVHAMRLVGF